MSELRSVKEDVMTEKSAGFTSLAKMKTESTHGCAIS
jgi:hypothetical protein